MAMNGTDVLLVVDGVVVGSQRDVTFNENTAEIDISNKEAREKYVLGGRYSAGVSLGALYVPDDAAYILLQTAMRDGTEVEIWKQVDGHAVEEADAIVTSLSEAAPDQAEATVAIELVISGPWRDVSS